MKDIVDTIVAFAVLLLILIVMALVFAAGYDHSEKSLIQKLCTQHQYDFCEVIEQQPEYKLKELKQDE